MSILTPLLIGRAAGGWRYIRVVLIVILIGCAVAGLVYAVVIFNAVRNTPERHHVEQHTTP
jgi:hypothetical protein